MYSISRSPSFDLSSTPKKHLKFIFFSIGRWLRSTRGLHELFYVESDFHRRQRSLQTWTELSFPVVTYEYCLLGSTPSESPCMGPQKTLRTSLSVPPLTTCESRRIRGDRDIGLHSVKYRNTDTKTSYLLKKSVSSSFHGLCPGLCAFHELTTVRNNE